MVGLHVVCDSSLVQVIVCFSSVFIFYYYYFSCICDLYIIYIKYIFVLYLWSGFDYNNFECGLLYKFYYLFSVRLFV